MNMSDADIANLTDTDRAKIKMENDMKYGEFSCFQAKTKEQCEKNYCCGSMKIGNLMDLRKDDGTKVHLWDVLDPFIFLMMPMEASGSGCGPKTMVSMMVTIGGTSESSVCRTVTECDLRPGGLVWSAGKRATRSNRVEPYSGGDTDFSLDKVQWSMDGGGERYVMKSGRESCLKEGEKVLLNWHNPREGAHTCTALDACGDNQRCMGVFNLCVKDSDKSGNGGPKLPESKQCVMVANKPGQSGWGGGPSGPSGSNGLVQPCVAREDAGTALAQMCEDTNDDADETKLLNNEECSTIGSFFHQVGLDFENIIAQLRTFLPDRVVKVVIQFAKVTNNVLGSIRSAIPALRSRGPRSTRQ